MRQSYMTALGFGVGFVEVMVAQEQGFFAEHGLDVQIRAGQGTATAMQAVIGGSVEYSRGGAITSVPAIASEEAPIINIGTVRQKTHFEIVSLPDQALTSPDQLAGKSVGVVSSGGSTEKLLLLVMSNAGVAERSVDRPVTGLGAGAYQLAKEGDVDAWVAPNYDRATVEQELGVELTAMKMSDFVEMPMDSYTTTVEMTESDNEGPRAFLAGVLQAMKFTMDKSNWDAVYESLRAYNPDATKEEVLFELPFQIESWTAAGEDKLLDLREDAWQNAQEEIKAAGFIDQTVPVDRLIYTDYIEAVKSAQ